MTQEEQIYRRDRRLAGAGVAAGILVTFFGVVELWRDGKDSTFHTSVTGAMTVFYLFSTISHPDGEDRVRAAQLVIRIASKKKPGTAKCRAFLGLVFGF